MKATTILAILAAGIGVLLILYFATRPRLTSGASSSSTSSDDDDEETPAAGAGRASRITRGVGTGLTELAAAIADAAS